jgi:hypothetical protein
VSPQLQQGANVRVAATQVTPGDAGFVSWIQPSHVGFHWIAHGDGSTLGKPISSLWWMMKCQTHQAFQILWIFNFDPLLHEIEEDHQD